MRSNALSSELILSLTSAASFTLIQPLSAFIELLHLTGHLPSGHCGLKLKWLSDSPDIKSEGVKPKLNSNEPFLFFVAMLICEKTSSCQTFSMFFLVVSGFFFFLIFIRCR